MSTTVDPRTTVEPRTTYTPEDLLTMPDGTRFELVDGRLVEPNVSNLSALVSSKINARLTTHCEAGDLGWVFTSEALYRCFRWKPNLVRKPDVSFVRRDRLTVEQLPEGFINVAPDLAVEVISPNDLAHELKQKLREYRRAGVGLIWVIDPEGRTASVHRADGTALDLEEDGVLDGEAVLPGFRCRLGDLLPPARAGEPA